MSARGLLALDTNNLSDPYVTVSLGVKGSGIQNCAGNSSVNSTKVVRKTLEPVWDEVFVFDSEDVVKACELGMGFVHMEMYDWDQFSQDDFMGHATISFSMLEKVFVSGLSEDGGADAHQYTMQRPYSVRLPVIGERKGVEEKHGTVDVCVWFGPDNGIGSGSGNEDGRMDFLPQLGLLGAPRHLHHQGGSMMEEPYFAVLCLSIMHIHASVDPLLRSTHQQNQVGGYSTTRELNKQMSEYNRALREKQVDDLLGLGEDDDDFDIFDSDDMEEGGSESQDSAGSFGYCRATLGGKTKTSHLVRQQGDKVPINDLLPFVLQVPLLDRELQITVYRTRKSKEKGRATHVALLSLLDILPDDLKDPYVDLRKVSKMLRVSLKSIDEKKYGDAEMTLCMSMADLDYRRVFQKFPHIVSKPMHHHYRGLFSDPRSMRQFQKKAKPLTERDIFQLGKKDATEYDEYKETKQWWDDQKDRAEVFLRGAIDRQIGKGVRMMDHILGRDHDDAKNALDEIQSIDIDEMQEDMPDHVMIPDVCGIVRLSLGEVTIPNLSNSNTNVFCVFKIEQMWFRTDWFRTNSKGTVSFTGFNVMLPITNPAAMLTMAVVARNRSKESKEVSRGIFNVIGKLRFRISSLKSNNQANVTLPFLSQRAQGGQTVGHANLQISAHYESQKIRLKGYIPPAYPKENYVYRTIPVMKTLQQERREMLFEWMSAANPPIPPEAIEAIEDVEFDSFAMSRLKVNLRRIKIALRTLGQFKKHYNLLASWKYPWLTRAACLFNFVITHYPTTVIPMFVIYMAYTCYTSRPDDVGIPWEMEQDIVSMNEVDTTEEEERVTGIKLEIESSNPVARLKKKLQSVMGILLMVQNYMDGIASFLERLITLFSWKDPLATTIITIVLTVASCVVYIVGFRVVIALLLCFLIRPPSMRSPWTPGPISLFLRLPTRGERLA